MISNGSGETLKITVHENRRKSPAIAGNRRKSPATRASSMQVTCPCYCSKKRSILLDNPVCVNHLKIRHRERQPASPEFEKEVGKLDLDTRFFFGGGVAGEKKIHYDNFVCVLKTITMISNGSGETLKITVHENRRKSPAIAGNRRKSPATLSHEVSISTYRVMPLNP
jgi:hypothetical protein